jgi:uncharacterized membrane protein YebE (DUF533 family)
LLEYDVSLAIWAHVHTYSRNCRMANGTCSSSSSSSSSSSGSSSNGSGVTHITIGTGGNAADVLAQTNASKAWTRYIDVGRNSVYGYLRMTPLNRSALDIKYLAIQKNDGANGTTEDVAPYVRDEFVLSA